MSEAESVHEAILSGIAVEYKRQASARELTTVGVGGRIDLLIDVPTPEAAASVIRRFSREKIPYRILGAGSNLLVADKGVRTPVLRLGRGFGTIEMRKEGVFSVGASMGFMRLARVLSRDGWSGLEFAGGIPATVGGALRMNAGAHGGEMGDIVSEVEVMFPDGSIEVLRRDALDFWYRGCSLPEGTLVVSVVVKMCKGEQDRVRTLLRKNLDYRKRTQPLTAPSFGSVFRNPTESDAAGALIEKAGLKGERLGGARISPLHGNWIVNDKKDAKFEEVVGLMNRCQKEVASQFGVELVPEVVRWIDD